MTPNLLIIVQARMGSTRFPGKVLAPLLGTPVLLWCLDRVSQVQTPHTLVVASPNTSGNEPIAALCTKHGYRCEVVDAPEDDVLSRFALVAEQYNAEEIVRITADCPLVDPQVIDALIAYHRWHGQSSYDHTGIAAEWADGLDAEMLSREALLVANHEATRLSDREHVCSYVWNHPDRFRCATLPCPFNLMDVQWSVDTSHDLSVLENLLKRTLARTGLAFTWRDLWATMAVHPAMRQEMTRRMGRNHAYTEQVAEEEGAPVQSWNRLRYRSVN